MASTEPQSAPAKRRARWWVIAAVIASTFAGVLLVLALGVYIERMRVATLLVQRYLASYGIESEIEFGRLSWGGFLLRVRAGPVDAPDFTAEGADVTLIYPEKGLVGQVTPQVASVRLIKPFMRLTYDGKKFTFGSLQRLVDDALSMDSTAPQPAVTVDNGTILLITPNGNLTAMADATVANGQLQHLQAALERGTFKGADFSANVAGGTVNADFAGGALNLKASLDLDAVSFQGTNARELKVVTDFRGLKWEGEGHSWRFAFASVDATVSAAAADSPDGSGGPSSAHIVMETTEGNFAEGQFRAGGRGNVDLALAQFHAADASFATLKSQIGLSTWTVNTSNEAWSVDSTGRVVSEGSGAQYRTSDGQITLAAFKSDVEGTAAIKSDGTSANFRGTFSANGNLPRAVALRSFQSQFDASGMIAKDGLTGTLRTSLSASANLPRALALDLAHHIPTLGGDEEIASTIATALQSATLRATDVTVSRSAAATTFSARAPLTIAGAQQASLTVAPRTVRPILKLKGDDVTGAFNIDLRGAEVPQLRASIASYRYRANGNRTLLDADAQFDTAFDFGSFRGVKLKGAGKLNLAGNRMNFAAPDCTDVALASFRNNGADQLRNIKTRLCGTALEIDGERISFTLPGCADVTFDSLVNSVSDVVSDAGGKLCGTMARPIFISEPAGWRFDGRLTDSSARIQSLGMRIANANGAIQIVGLAGDIKTGNVNVGSASLSDLAPDPRFLPLTASGAIRATGADWQGNFNLATAKGRLTAVALRHSLATGSGEAAIDARGLNFEPNGLQPANIVPFFSAFGSRFNGRSDFTGRVAWTKDGFTSEGRLVLANMDFRSRVGMVRQVNADLALSSLIPVALRPNQTVTASRIELFVPIEQATARFSYTPEALRLEAVTANVADGRVTLDPLTYNFVPDATTSGTVRLTNLNVTPLIAAAGLADRMSASAGIDGVVPFTLTPQGVRFNNGRIVANGPGRLSIKRQALTTSVGVGTGAQPPPNAVQDFAYQALENLAFEQLDGTVNSRPMGRLGLLLHLKGRNDPAQVAEARVGVVDLLRGRAFDKPVPLPKGTPIDLTLDTSLNLDELLNSYFSRVADTAADESCN